MPSCRTTVLSFSAVLMSTLSSLPAATLYWDTNGTTAGTGSTATGSWNTTAGNNVWSTSANGDLATQIYTANSDVVFAAGTDMTSASVTLTGSATANSLTFEEGSVATLGTATLTIGNGGITLNSGVGTINLNRVVLGSSAVPTTVAVTMNTATNAAGSSLILGSTALTRNGIILFRGSNLGTNTAGSLDSANITFGIAPTLTGAGAAGTTTVGIISRATGDASSTGSGSDFVTYDATNGVRILTNAEYSSTITAGTNVKVTGAVTNTGATTLNSLIIGAGGSVSGGTSVAVTSGDVLIGGGANNGITTALSTSGSGTLSINAVNNLTGVNISGGGVINKFGLGTTSFTTVDGSINVNEGTFVVNGGNKTKSILINGGTFRIGASNSIIDGNNISVNTGGTLELTASITETINVLSGAGSVNGGANSVLTIGNSNGSSSLSGAVTGGLSLVKIGTGSLTLSGALTNTGNITVNAGTATFDTASNTTFYIGANTVTNSVSGAGTATFSGTFNFNLINANLTNGNSWTVANVTTQTFAGTFAVNGFTDADLDNVWTNGAGLSFSELTGILSYSAVPEPSTYALLAGAGMLLVAAFRQRMRTRRLS